MSQAVRNRAFGSREWKPKAELRRQQTQAEFVWSNALSTALIMPICAFIVMRFSPIYLVVMMALIPTLSLATRKSGPQFIERFSARTKKIVYLGSSVAAAATAVAFGMIASNGSIQIQVFFGVLAVAVVAVGVLGLRRFDKLPG